MAQIVVPFDGGAASRRALHEACRVASAAQHDVRAVYVIRVPRQLPIQARLVTEHEHAHALFDQAHAIADGYGARLTTLTVEAREIGWGIVEAARDCDLVMMGEGPRGSWSARLLVLRTLRRARLLHHVKAHAPCQVLLVPMDQVDTTSGPRPYSYLQGA